jgi:hypothetical protein
MDEMGALCQALDAEHKNIHILMHRDPKAQGGFKGGSKRKDSWFVDRFDELLKTHGPQFDRQCHYTPVAAEELARYLCIIYPEHVKAGS